MDVNIKHTGAYGLVTGASMGLGRCFALELAKRGINTLLVSLPGEGLGDVAEEARSYGTDSQIFETDITRKENIYRLCDWIEDRFDVFLLINNAGMGGTRSILGCDLEYLDSIIRLNITAPTLLIHRLLPNLLRQDDAYILNVSSMASFSPMGYKTVYPASKRFMQHFSMGLAEELAATNVTVSIVHPGPMKTNEDVTSRIERQGILGRLGLLEPEKVARESIRNLFNRTPRILPGLGNKINYWLLRMIPIPVKLHYLTRAVYREIASQTQP